MGPLSVSRYRGAAVLLPPLLLAALAVAPVAHEQSVSHSRLAVRGSAAVLEMRCQTPSLLEGVAKVDGDGDGVLTAEELAAGRAEVEAYFVANYRLTPADSADGPTAFTGRLTFLGFATDIEDEDRRFQWVDARIEFSAATPLENFDVHSRLFTERDEYHRDFLVVTWNDDEPVSHLFIHGKHDWEFRPAHVRRPGVLITFVRLGIDHILTGYDHLCFLLALIVASRTLRSLVGVVTAFTLAHSITLALAALDVVNLDQGFIELAIVLSIAYVAAENLLLRRPRTPWLEAFVFGLLHGLGFAGFLGEALVGEQLVITALFGFNLGVEAGQLLFVTAFVLVSALLFRRRRPSSEEGEPPAPSLVPAWFRLTASAAIVLVALYWFTERAGWIG